MTEDKEHQVDTPKVALVDADFMVYSVGFASSDDDSLQMQKNRITEWLTDIVYMNLNCEDYKAYITGPGNFRYDVAKTVPYKGNRKDAAKPKYYEELREHLVRLGAVITEGIEADDAVAIESGKADYWLVHVDKDLNQLKGWHYNPNKDQTYYVTEFEAMSNFYTQMLTGDRVDNIPGLPGIGPKKAEKIFKDVGTVKGLHEAAVGAYKDKGFDMEYFVEQGRLLWLQREEGQVWQPNEVSH